MQRGQNGVSALAHHHNWAARPGHKILVLDRGAVSFECPASWIVAPAEDCVKLFGREPPDDECTLAVSYLMIPVMDWSDLPVSRLVRTALEGDERQFLEVSPIQCERRLSLEMGWCEGRVHRLARKASRNRSSLRRPASSDPGSPDIRLLGERSRSVCTRMGYGSLDVGAGRADPGSHRGPVGHLKLPATQAGRGDLS